MICRRTSASLSRRIEQAEDARGAARVDEPEQLLSRDAAGHFTLEFRPQLETETQNASLSLAANLAIADALLAHRTGLFRVMPEPDERSIWRLRHSAKALGLVWPKAMPLKTFEQSLDAANPRDAAFQADIRRAGPKASYAPYARRQRPVAFGDGGDLRACDGAVAAAGRPLRDRVRAAGRQWRAGFRRGRGRLPAAPGGHGQGR